MKDNEIFLESDLITLFVFTPVISIIAFAGLAYWPEAYGLHASLVFLLLFLAREAISVRSVFLQKIKKGGEYNFMKFPKTMLCLALMVGLGYLISYLVGVPVLGSGFNATHALIAIQVIYIGIAIEYWLNFKLWSVRRDLQKNKPLNEIFFKGFFYCSKLKEKNIFEYIFL